MLANGIDFTYYYVMIGEGAVMVTDVADRSPQRKIGVTYGMPFGDFPSGTAEAWGDNGGQDQYRFPSLGALRGVLTDAIELVRQGRVADAIVHVEAASLPAYEDLDPQNKWEFWNGQMPEDWGPSMERRRETQRMLTAKSSGVVLEAMCGFTTYIGTNNPEISQVIAMDFSREGLARYPYPKERPRILFDLNSIDASEPETGMGFFPDDSINTISICYGINYLDRPLDAYMEFQRVLAPGGKLLIVGGTLLGYGDLVTQHFNPLQTKPLLDAAGFDSDIQRLPYENRSTHSRYYLIESTKR